METTIRVRLTPRASNTELAGWQAGVLRVRVTAPPVDGRANEALVRLLADALDLPRSAVRIVSGRTSRDKQVAVDGLAQEEVLRRLQHPDGA